MKSNLEKDVEEVRISTRLGNVPCVVLPNSQGLSAGQEKIMKMQNVGKETEWQWTYYMGLKRILEINPKHAIIENLLHRLESGEEALVDKLAPMLFETYAVSSGFEPRNLKSYNSVMGSFLAQFLGIPMEDTFEKHQKVEEHQTAEENQHQEL